MSGWSATTNSSPRSAPAASSATSPTPTARVRLTELLRFTDPAEAAATLALRDGRPEALGFYLDQRRIHVGDLTTLTDDVFAAWQADRSSGLDAIMLAPTRELVANSTSAPAPTGSTQNQTRPRPSAVRAGELADGNQASRRRPDHHPQQRPPPPHDRHRLGEERRPLDRPRGHRGTAT